MDGNLKSVMRIILALAAHFKPSANHRAASGNGKGSTRGTSSHNPRSPIALAQGAAAALASARHDVSQPARTSCLPRYARFSSETGMHSLLSSAGQILLINNAAVVFLNHRSAISRQLGAGYGKECVRPCLGSAV